MRFSPFRLALLAAFSLAGATGCETHDRVLYHYQGDPVRPQKPDLYVPGTTDQMLSPGSTLPPASMGAPAPSGGAPAPVTPSTPSAITPTTPPVGNTPMGDTPELAPEDPLLPVAP